MSRPPSFDARVDGDEISIANGVGTETSVDDQPWRSIFADSVLSRPPAQGSPGNVPPGEDLRLDIGWEKFEQLLVFVAQAVLGLSQVRFRRYGVAGQKQHGIDLAGRHPDGQYTVVQCKEYDSFGAADLRAAVERFATGRRPFRATHLIVALSTVARTTQLEDALAGIQDEYQDLRIEVWGAEQINEELRNRADIVSRFWTRETAETFCTGAPLPGVAAPPPNWVRVADQVLLSPLGVDGLDAQLTDADRLRVTEPRKAVDIYRLVGERLAMDGFTGHAHLIWRKELDALVAAGDFAGAAGLAARLAITALFEGDINQARILEHELSTLVRGQSQGTRPVTEGLAGGHEDDETAEGIGPAAQRHADLTSAAVQAASHPMGDLARLKAVMYEWLDSSADLEYWPLLVLVLGELTLADATVEPNPAWENSGLDGATDTDSTLAGLRLTDLDELITSALAHLEGERQQPMGNDVVMRLRLLRAFYRSEERHRLLAAARQLRLPRLHAALVLAAEARREALDGSTEMALEYWRQAVSHAIHEGRTDDARGWLYAIRAVNSRFGPWTSRIDEEHLLAQALPKTGAGRLIRRVRDHEIDARRNALDKHPIEALAAARRWLADSIVLGDWVDENAASELLGDLYAANSEPGRAAACFQWAGETKKLVQLASDVKDRLLPYTPVGSGPWWQQQASLASLAVQNDLLEDNTARRLLPSLIELVSRGRAGELIEGPGRGVTLQATKTACVLAGRGSRDDAQALLNLLLGDVGRAEDRYQPHDKEHVRACKTIAQHHIELTWPAVSRIFDLAEVGTDPAVQELQNDFVIDLLREPDARAEAASSGDSSLAARLTGEERSRLRARLRSMAEGGRYEAGLAMCALGEADEAVMEAARQARERLLNRPEPDGRSFSFGSRMVPDSYLVTFLDSADQVSCLDKMLAVAADRREAAPNRQAALTAASNLILQQDNEVKGRVHSTSRPFVDGDQDGSYMDSEMTNPHPLSTWRVDLGSPSLQAAGLRLALNSAVTHEERMWVRDRAAAMLGSDDEELVGPAAGALFGLGTDILDALDPTLLAGHPLPVVRQLAALAAAAAPGRYADVLITLVSDSDNTVRKVLARQLHKARVNASTSTSDASALAQPLERLSKDARHSVRRAAVGLDA